MKLQLSTRSKLNWIIFLKFYVTRVFLLIAYAEIRKNAAAGLDNVTLSALCSLAKELSSERYKCIPVWKLYINKPQGGKIVQKAIQMLIQPTFECKFSDHSHEFRPLRTCHTALNPIQRRK